MSGMPSILNAQIKAGELRLLSAVRVMTGIPENEERISEKSLLLATVRQTGRFFL